MGFFIRIVVLFLVVFAGLSFAIQNFFVSAPGTDVIMPSSLTMALPPSAIRVQDTQTGLLLAGRVAQNNRDWAYARENFTVLNDQFDGDAFTALRVMTLALGAGDFASAEAVAEDLNTDHLSNKDFKNDGETFDLARLFLIAKAIKGEDIEGGQVLLESLNKGALSAFAKPIIGSILTAGAKDKKLTSSVQNMSALQMIYKALSAEFAGQIEVAKSLFDRVAKQRITPQTAEMIAAFYMRHDDQAQALSVLRRVRLGFPDDKGVQDAVSMIEDEEKSYEAPSFASYHLKSLHSILALAFHDLARVMVSERANDSALLFAQMALYADEHVPGAAMTIGDIFASQRQYESALLAYKSVLETDADYTLTQIEIAEILYKMDKHDEAVDHLEAFVKHEKYQEANVYLALANLYKEGNDFEDAVATYDIAEIKGRAENDNEAPTWMWLLHYFRGVSFDQLDQFENAEKDLLKALEARPNNATLLNYLGYSYADKGENLEKAKEMIERAVQQAPEDAHIVDSMGWVLYRMDDYVGAVEYLERAAKLSPYHVVINDHLGDAYWKVGRKLEAHYMWQRAVDYAPEGSEDKELDADEIEEMEAAKNAEQKLKVGLVEG